MDAVPVARVAAGSSKQEATKVQLSEAASVIGVAPGIPRQQGSMLAAACADHAVEMGWL